MKVLISGSRTITDNKIFLDCIKKSKFFITEIVCGFDEEKQQPEGIDLLAYYYAKRYNIIVHTYPADWNKYKKAAGPIRNEQMVRESGAEALIAIWDSVSRGTINTVNLWKKYRPDNKNIQIFTIK